jgi:predicted N-acetyltransferase YhbS
MPSPPVSLCHTAAQHQQVTALLERSWPGIGAAIERAARVGAPWFAGSTPFAVFEGGEAIAHAGVLELPMIVEGAAQRVAGIHGVCTHPERRGEGLARAVIEAALDHCEPSYAAVLLFTVEPALYRRFGFRAVVERSFLAQAPSPARHGHRFRPLAADDAGDVALVHRLCRERAPVSRRLGPCEPGWLFVLDEILARGRFDRLYYAPGLETLAVLERDGRLLNVYDLVAPTLPSLAELLGALDFAVEGLRLYFTPDRFEAEFADAGARVRARALTGFDQLMVRGPLACEQELFLIPPLARC